LYSTKIFHRGGTETRRRKGRSRKASVRFVALRHTSDWRAEEAEKDGAEGAGLETLVVRGKVNP
jgi:hypothetical protein